MKTITTRRVSIAAARTVARGPVGVSSPPARAPSSPPPLELSPTSDTLMRTRSSSTLRSIRAPAAVRVESTNPRDNCSSSGFCTYCTCSRCRSPARVSSASPTRVAVTKRSSAADVSSPPEASTSKSPSIRAIPLAPFDSTLTEPANVKPSSAELTTRKPLGMARTTWPSAGIGLVVVKVTSTVETAPARSSSSSSSTSTSSLGSMARSGAEKPSDESTRRPSESSSPACCREYVPANGGLTSPRMRRANSLPGWRVAAAPASWSACSM
mmetsp:Transcript_1147/g.2993  ORF Transcript_1147/g.2993 Transcript_1147/m.2993 type:complete len:269 (+) Transcript_1147:213-1019(+)